MKMSVSRGIVAAHSKVHHSKVHPEGHSDLKLVASFDIGEKNFAYAIGDKESIKVWKYHDVVRKKNQTVVESCEIISKLLEDEPLLPMVGQVIIEQQMRANVRAQRLSQHLWTWFSIKLPNSRPRFVPSHLKTQHFIGKNKLLPKERKKWAIVKTEEILTKREDLKSLSYLRSLEKKDDVCDSFLQLLAYVSSP